MITKKQMHFSIEIVLTNALRVNLFVYLNQ